MNVLNYFKELSVVTIALYVSVLMFVGIVLGVCIAFGIADAMSIEQVSTLVQLIAVPCAICGFYLTLVS